MQIRHVFIISNWTTHKHNHQLHVNRRETSWLWLFRDEEWRVPWGWGVCTDFPSGMRLLGPPLRRGWSLGYRSSSLGTVLGFACSLGTAHNPLMGQHGVWVEDGAKSAQSWFPDISHLQDHPSWSAWGLHWDRPAVQCLLGPVPREPKVRWWRMFPPHLSHIDFICNFLLWKYASILKSQENNITHQPYQHLAILVSSNPL